MSHKGSKPVGEQTKTQSGTKSGDCRSPAKEIDKLKKSSVLQNNSTSDDGSGCDYAIVGTNLTTKKLGDEFVDVLVIALMKTLSFQDEKTHERWLTEVKAFTDAHALHKGFGGTDGVGTDGWSWSCWECRCELEETAFKAQAKADASVVVWHKLATSLIQRELPSIPERQRDILGRYMSDHMTHIFLQVVRLTRRTASGLSSRATKMIPGELTNMISNISSVIDDAAEGKEIDDYEKGRGWVRRGEQDDHKAATATSKERDIQEDELVALGDHGERIHKSLVSDAETHNGHTGFLSFPYRWTCRQCGVSQTLRLSPA